MKTKEKAIYGERDNSNERPDPRTLQALDAVIAAERGLLVKAATLLKAATTFCRQTALARGGSQRPQTRAARPTKGSSGCAGRNRFRLAASLTRRSGFPLEEAALKKRCLSLCRVNEGRAQASAPRRRWARGIRHRALPVIAIDEARRRHFVGWPKAGFCWRRRRAWWRLCRGVSS